MKKNSFISIIIISSIFVLSWQSYALDPVLTIDDIKQSIVIDNLKVYKEHDGSISVRGTCGIFSVISVEKVEPTNRNIGVDVGSIHLDGAKHYIFNNILYNKNHYSIGDWFHKIICTKNNNKSILVIESYQNNGAANEPTPYNYVIDAFYGKFITKNCDRLCLKKYLRKS